MTKGLVGLGTSGTIECAVAIGVTGDAERKRFLFQDVIVELVVYFSPRQSYRYFFPLVSRPDPPHILTRVSLLSW